MNVSTSMAVRVRVLSVPRAAERGGHPGHGDLVGGLEDVEEVVLTEQGVLLEHLHAHRLELGVDLLEPAGFSRRRAAPSGPRVESITYFGMGATYSGSSADRSLDAGDAGPRRRRPRSTGTRRAPRRPPPGTSAAGRGRGRWRRSTDGRPGPSRRRCTARPAPPGPWSRPWPRRCPSSSTRPPGRPHPRPPPRPRPGRPRATAPPSATTTTSWPSSARWAFTASVTAVTSSVPKATRTAQAPTRSGDPSRPHAGDATGGPVPASPCRGRRRVAPWPARRAPPSVRPVAVDGQERPGVGDAPRSPVGRAARAGGVDPASPRRGVLRRQGGAGGGPRLAGRPRHDRPVRAGPRAARRHHHGPGLGARLGEERDPAQRRRGHRGARRGRGGHPPVAERPHHRAADRAEPRRSPSCCSGWSARRPTRCPSASWS